ncbi:MAG TPA: M28 family peptidase [Bryobacteraceae bacterium]|nr:M28 family peptidase [Bryobacteraceae bacterium]
MKYLKLLALCLLAVALTAQTRTRIATGLEDIQAAKLRADLTFLSSDALEGRMSLERGSEVAIQWIASEFLKAGLKPAFGDGFLQPVPLVEYKMDRENTFLKLRMHGAEQTFHAPDATGNYPNDGVYKGRVVFAGFGITAPELRYDDYAGIDARGKIVLVFNHEPQEDDASSIFNGKGNTRYANARAKMMIAQRHGAVALLIAPDPNHKAGNQRGPLDAGGRGGQNLRTPRPTQAIAEEDSIPVFNVSAGAAETLLAATGKKPSELQTAIDSTLKPQSAALGDAEAELHIATAQRKRQLSYNVAGIVEGSDPQLKNEAVLFSGHYDHDGLRIDGGIYHGADDNGSGTIGVVALAHAFAKNPAKPKRSLLFIVFAAEERGLLGSYYYAAHPLRPLQTTRAQINFDMIGRDEKDSAQTHGLIDIAADTSNEVNIVGTKYSPDYRKEVEQANEFVGLHLNYKWDDDTVLNVLFRSDQYPLLLHDIPAMWWFTGFHPDYHQVTDTVEKINFTKMEKILKLAFISGFDFADSSTPPKFFAQGAPK